MSLTESARTELTLWQPPTPSQASLRDDFVAHLDTHDNGWERRCRPDHLTASALVINSSASHVLLCLHRKVGLWLQFGGHIEDGDTSVADAALREAKEESGIDELTLVGSGPMRLDRHAAPCDDQARYHLDVQYLAVAADGAEPTVSSESIDVRWFSPDALPEQTDDAVRQLVADAIANARECAVDLERDACPLQRERPPVEEATRSFDVGAALEERPEPRTVGRLKKVRELMQQDVVDHPVRHPLQSIREPNRGILNRARTPSGALVGHPPDAARKRPSVEVPRRQPLRSHPQLVVGRFAAPLLSLEPLEHRCHPLLFLSGRHPSGKEHDSALTFAVGRHRPPAAGAPPNLDIACPSPCPSAGPPEGADFVMPSP